MGKWMNTREIITEALKRVAAGQDADLVSDLNNDTILLESGLDSLGFAVLVAELEEVLGFDPFVMMDTPVYPETLGDFVAFYEKYSAPSDAASSSTR